MSTSDMQDANLQEALVTYEKLQDIEDDMDEVEVEIRKSFPSQCHLRIYPPHLV